MMSEGGDYCTFEELREAKELAIKWHKVATNQQAQLSEWTVEAVRSSELEKVHCHKLADWRNRCTWTFAIGVFAGMVAYGFGANSADSAPYKGYLFTINYQDGSRANCIATKVYE